MGPLCMYSHLNFCNPITYMRKLNSQDWLVLSQNSIRFSLLIFFNSSKNQNLQSTCQTWFDFLSSRQKLCSSVTQTLDLLLLTYLYYIVQCAKIQGYLKSNFISTHSNKCHITGFNILKYVISDKKLPKTPILWNFWPKKAYYSNTVHVTLFHGMLLQKRKQFLDIFSF